MQIFQEKLRKSCNFTGNLMSVLTGLLHFLWEFFFEKYKNVKTVTELDHCIIKPHIKWQKSISKEK